MNEIPPPSLPKGAVLGGQQQPRLRHHHRGGSKVAASLDEGFVGDLDDALAADVDFVIDFNAKKVKILSERKD